MSATSIVTGQGPQIREYDANGEFDAPAARRDHNGVSPVPDFATPAAVGTRYETNTMTFGTRVFSPPGDPSLSP